MCRLAVYFGPPVRLSTLLSEPAHGLVRQSYAPREMTSGLLNADGWGVGWFAPGLGPRPGVIRGVLPIWSDENAAGVTHAIASGSILAAVRSATPGQGVATANTPPYADGDGLFAHNGRIWPWPGTVAGAMRDGLDLEDEVAIRGTTDSERLWALWRACGRRAGDAVEGLRRALDLTRRPALDTGGGIAANVIWSRADGFLAARFADPGPPPSLYLLRHAARWTDGVLVASEPLDDSVGWEAVPPSTALRVDAGGVRFERLFP